MWPGYCVPYLALFWIATAQRAQNRSCTISHEKLCGRMYLQYHMPQYGWHVPLQHGKGELGAVTSGRAGEQAHWVAEKMAGLRLAFTWQQAAWVAVVSAVAVATNPDEAHFVEFVQEYAQRGYGYLPGMGLAQNKYM